MKKMIVISIFIFFAIPMHKAYAIKYGKCYKTKKSYATHGCLLIEEAKKILEDLRVYKKKAEKLPLLEQQIKIKDSTIFLLKEQRIKADKTVTIQEKAIEKHETASANLNSENKDLLSSIEEYKKEVDQMARQRWVFLGIGLGAGMIIATGVIVAVSILTYK